MSTEDDPRASILESSTDEAGHSRFKTPPIVRFLPNIGAGINLKNACLGDVSTSL